MSALAVAHVHLAVGNRRLFDDLSFRVEPGAIVTVMGPSGAGKSALLAFIAGHLDPAFAARGQVRLGARDLAGLPPQRRNVGLMFQDDLLFPHLSVGANVAFGLAASLGGRAARRAAVAQALQEAGLAGFETRDPATLSGGQRARVALMRTLASEPEALLLDEPFAKLDMALRQEMRRFVFDHAARRALPVVLVTHDPADAQAAGGAVVTLGSDSIA